MKRIAFFCLLLTITWGFRLRAQTQLNPTASQLAKLADSALSESHASLCGTLKDERGNPLINAFVECSAGGIVTGREVTDFDGNYTIRPLDSGTVVITFKYQGKELVITDINLAGGTANRVDATMTIPGCNYRNSDIRCIRTTCRRPPLIDPSAPGGRITHSNEMLW